MTSSREYHRHHHHQVLFESTKCDTIPIPILVRSPHLPYYVMFLFLRLKYPGMRILHSEISIFTLLGLLILAFIIVRSSAYRMRYCYKLLQNETIQLLPLSHFLTIVILFYAFFLCLPKIPRNTCTNLSKQAV